MILSKNGYRIATDLRGEPSRLQHLLLTDPRMFEASWNAGSLPRDWFSGQSEAPIKVSELMRNNCLYCMRENGWKVRDLRNPQTCNLLATSMREHWEDGNPTLPISVWWSFDPCQKGIPDELAETLVGHIVHSGLRVKFRNRQLMVVDAILLNPQWDVDPFSLKGQNDVEYIALAEARMVEMDVNDGDDLSRFHPTKDEDIE